MVRRLVAGGRQDGLSPSDRERTFVVRSCTDAIRLVAGTAHVGRCRFAGRRLLDRWVRSLTGGWIQSSHFAPRQRLSGMRCHSLLLTGKWHRRWGWRPFRDHLPVDDCSWWRGHTIRGRELRSQYALTCGSYRNPRAHWGASDLARVYGNRF